MNDRSANRIISVADALAIAEELVSAPGNDNLVVWLQPGRGGVTLRQQLIRPAQPESPVSAVWSGAAPATIKR